MTKAVFNPNTLSQLADAVVDDLRFVGMIVYNRRSYPEDYPPLEYFSVGNESMTLAKVRIRFNEGGCAVASIASVPNPGPESKVRYRGEMERFSREICQRVVSKSLRTRTLSIDSI